jgi:hypothetical protein
MKTTVATIKTILLALFISSGSVVTGQNDDEAIEKTARNYIEGWYSGDTARMSAALAPTLVKRGFITDHRTGKQAISEATFSQMVDWTGRKPNEYERNPDIRIEVKIIEKGANIAMVKTVSPAYIDYIHMGKINGMWKIYNVIWEPNQAVK